MIFINKYTVLYDFKIFIKYLLKKLTLLLTGLSFDIE